MFVVTSDVPFTGAMVSLVLTEKACLMFLIFAGLDVGQLGMLSETRTVKVTSALPPGGRGSGTCQMISVSEEAGE